TARKPLLSRGRRHDAPRPGHPDQRKAPGTDRLHAGLSEGGIGGISVRWSVPSDTRYLTPESRMVTAEFGIAPSLACDSHSPSLRAMIRKRFARRGLLAVAVVTAGLAVAPGVAAQTVGTEYRGAQALGLALRQVGTTERVLMIAA